MLILDVVRIALCIAIVITLIYFFKNQNKFEVDNKLKPSKKLVNKSGQRLYLILVLEVLLLLIVTLADEKNYQIVKNKLGIIWKSAMF